jgi:isopentenyl diphosphate isomerase/L-lactate dehydrogenase-like FMN-dependent dehydrogenase
VHPDGSGAIARAAKGKRMMRIGGTQSGVNQPDDPLVWATSQGPRPDAERLRKLDTAGCPAYVWNIDHGGGGNQIGGRSVQRAQVRNLERSKDERCNSCHKTDGPGGESSGPYAGRRITIDDPLDIIGALGSRPQDPRVRTLTWDDVSRAKESMKRMKLVLKGIQTGDDADLAVRHGADGIEVSNHGGHSDAFGRGAIECLPEVVAAVKGRVPVFIDSGFRAGIDIYKALALGATAVGVARPKAWAVGAFGQEGVETLIMLLRRELQVVMADTGASTVPKISRSSLMTRSL